MLATLEVFKMLQDFDIVDFCNLYSDVHNPVSFSFANYKNVLNHACTYNVYKQKQTRRTINMVTRKADVFCSIMDSSVVRALYKSN